ncbi:MAG: DNA (cytosine-5-)-methyltransferase [Mesonia sp.]|nr:DNA (cytosine-5-)-methyltransferase [Mesonia sp.]
MCNSLKAVDFFCGAGGVTCGFSQIGIEVLGGIDIDSKFKDTYEKNNGSKFLNEDVSNLDTSKLQELLPIKKNDNNLIFVGCSPCQYYSNIKSDKRKSAKGRLLLEDFKEFILFYKPGYVFVENVPGLNTKKGSPIENFKNTLSKQGYSFDFNVLNAKHFEVPQNRRRFVLIASRVMGDIKLPENKINKKNITVKEAIGNYQDFPQIQHGHKDLSDFQHSTARLSDLNLLRVSKTPLNGGSRKAWENDAQLQLECYKNHKGHTDVYGRLKWSKPAPTITTRFIYTSTGRYSHPEQNRGLSLREGATLQSFPKDYVFHSNNQGAIATMIGNAVPPNLAKAVGASIKNHWQAWQHLRQKQEQ